ncbi:MAG: TonB-dependent receptor plug domain-containing protein, partial [Nitrospiria bacterium]
MKIWMFRVYAALSLSLVFCAGSFGRTNAKELSAEEKLLMLEPIVVTAKRIPSPMLEVGSSITVIQGEDLQKRNITTVPEALREVAGVDVARSGGLGKQTSIFLRGANSSHTLVLINGVQVNSPSTGAFDFGNLLVDNIDRIEVLRGPQSSLYGSEAIGGVIHIITKKGEGKTVTSLYTEFGSFETFRQRIGITGSEGETDYALSISRLESEGISAASEQNGNTEDDGYNNMTLSHRLGFNFLQNGRIDYTLRYIAGENEIDVFGADDPNRTLERDAVYTSLRLQKPVTDFWTPSIQFSIADEQLEQNDPDALASNSLLETNVQNILLQNELFLSHENILLFGLEYDQEMGDRQGSFDKKVDTRSLFIEDQAVFLEHLFLTAGVRYDEHNIFGEKSTFRITSAYAVEKYGMTAHASYGTGFRAPSINELFWPGASNKSLQAEESKGYDVGIRKEYPNEGEHTKSWFDVTYFSNDFDELVSFPAPNFIPVNINKAEADGLEFSSGIGIMQGLLINLSYTYMESEDKSTGKQLLRRAKHKGMFGILYDPTDRFDLNLIGTVVEDRIDFSGTKMDDYVKVNFTSGYRVTDKLGFFIRVENLFDEDYEDVTGFTSPGISGFGGIKLTL